MRVLICGGGVIVNCCLFPQSVAAASTSPSWNAPKWPQQHPAKLAALDAIDLRWTLKDIDAKRSGMITSSIGTANRDGSHRDAARCLAPYHCRAEHYLEGLTAISIAARRSSWRRHCVISAGGRRIGGFPSEYSGLCGGSPSRRSRSAFLSIAERRRCNRLAICEAEFVGHNVTSSRSSSSVQRVMAGLDHGGPSTWCHDCGAILVIVDFSRRHTGAREKLKLPLTSALRQEQT